MATDATGTPTSKGIPKYDTANDAPSGLGFNAAMDAIDALLGWVKARKNSTGTVFSRARLNLIEGAGIQITMADDATDNEVDVTITSTATGDPWQVVFTPLANEAPASAFATLDTRNSHPVLDFDDTTAEAAVFSGILPAGYGGNGVRVSLVWAATTATSGNVVWNVAFERIDDSLDIDSDSFATANAATAGCAGVSGQKAVTNINFSNGAEMDGLVAGEPFRLKVSRNAADGSDTMTGDAELLAVAITEQ